MSAPRPLPQALKMLIPLVPSAEKRRFWGLLLLTVIMALIELAITGLVALLAAVFGSLEAALNHNPLLWVRTGLGFDLGNDSRYLSLGILCAILLAIVCKNALTVVQQWHMTAFSETIGNAARTHLLRFYLCAPFLWVFRVGTSEMLFGSSAGAQLGQTLLTALQIFSNTLMILTIFLGLVVVSPVPALTFLCVLGLGGYLIVKGTRKMLNAKAAAVYRADLATHNIQQTVVHGLKEMRLYGRENAIFSAYTAKLNDVVVAKKWFQALSRLPVGSLEVLGFASLVGVLLFLIYVQNAGIATISGIMGFLAAAAWRTLPVANRLVDNLTQLRSSLPYLNKVADIITLGKELKAEMAPSFETPATPIVFNRDIKLDRICFRYPGASAAALQNIDFTIKTGQMFGLVGLSGAGKSTLVNILAGLVPPESGHLLVDDTPITKNNARSWLQRIGYVAQAPYLLDASLAENIALSRWGETIDHERVLECCRMAALDFIDDLDNGIDTVLGERGVRLSGGQAQRVAIARALYSEPELIIFDEATSSLDMKNEKSIHETILSLRAKVTIVIIAHRLSTVENCDSVIWLDKGSVQMAGRAEDVLPRYKEALNASLASQ
ncbi:ABC transporter ATP-binding protein [Desulfovibrio sp.]|uniref:ABC transporter ATP-binding protein n=1 Tax=Desulfovibrio sp. TaxID=885 RepID=UPI0025BE5041|nr:ABC transporter ATP-binding protein [Desulfovibrio sp.]